MALGTQQKRKETVALGGHQDNFRKREAARG